MTRSGWICRSGAKSALPEVADRIALEVLGTRSDGHLLDHGLADELRISGHEPTQRVDVEHVEQEDVVRESAKGWYFSSQHSLA